MNTAQVTFEKPKHAGGRPTDYREEYCEQLIKHMKSGYSFDSFAAVVDVNSDTLYEWLKVHKKFSETYERAKKQNLFFWEKLGVQGTAGKLPGFNAATYALNMANRHKWYSARQDVTTDGQKIESPILYIPKEEEK